MRKLMALTLLSGCGSTMWALTPRPEPVVSEVTHYAPTYGGYPVAQRELRRRSDKPIWPALLGTVVDTVIATTLVVAAGDHDDGQPALIFGALGVSAIALDTFLIAGRSSVDEHVEPAVTWMSQGVIPMPSQAPGSGTTVISRSFDSRAQGNWPVMPSCSLEVNATATPASPPSASTPVDVVTPTD